MTNQINQFLIRPIEQISTLSGWRRYLVAFLGGIFATLAMAPYYLLPLLIIGYCGLFLMLTSLGGKGALRPLKRAFLTGWAFGFGYFLTGLYWMGFAFLARGEQFIWLLPIAIPAFCAFLGLFFALPSLAYVWFIKKWGNYPSTTPLFSHALLFASLLSVFEYARGHILTGLPWNNTGQALTGWIAGAQTASIYGVYGLGFLVLILSLFAVSRINKSMVFGWPLTIAGLVLLYASGFLLMYVTPTALRDDVQVSIVQPNIRQKDKINPALASQNFEKLLKLSASSNAGRDHTRPSDYIIWPENAVAWIGDQPHVLNAIKQSIAPETIILGGSLRQQRDESGKNRFFNTLAIVEDNNSDRQVSHYYDKHHLVPFGEYLPLKGLLRALGLAKIMPVEDGFTAGSGPQILHFGPAPFAPLICYEAIFPGKLYPKGQRPEWLMTVTNDAWFGDGAGPKQHLDQARLRSIETGLPMLRSANTGISAVIDANGRVIDKIPLYQQGVLDTFLPPAKANTIYNLLGDWLYGMMLAASFLYLRFMGKNPHD